MEERGAVRERRGTRRAVPRGSSSTSDRSAGSGTRHVHDREQTPARAAERRGSFDPRARRLDDAPSPTTAHRPLALPCTTSSPRRPPPRADRHRAPLTIVALGQPTLDAPASARLEKARSGHRGRAARHARAAGGERRRRRARRRGHHGARSLGDRRIDRGQRRGAARVARVLAGFAPQSHRGHRELPLRSGLLCVLCDSVVNPRSATAPGPSPAAASRGAGAAPPSGDG
jgi:hypothetical protein